MPVPIRTTKPIPILPRNPRRWCAASESAMPANEIFRVINNLITYAYSLLVNYLNEAPPAPPILFKRCAKSNAFNVCITSVLMTWLFFNNVIVSCPSYTHTSYSRPLTTNSVVQADPDAQLRSRQRLAQRRHDVSQREHVSSAVHDIYGYHWKFRYPVKPSRSCWSIASSTVYYKIPACIHVCGAVYIHVHILCTHAYTVY